MYQISLVDVLLALVLVAFFLLPILQMVLVAKVEPDHSTVSLAMILKYFIEKIKLEKITRCTIFFNLVS